MAFLTCYNFSISRICYYWNFFHFDFFLFFIVKYLLVIIIDISALQVQADSILANFHNLHHLFFIASKLINDVVKSQPLVISVESTNCTTFSSEGGFLRQPSIDSSPGTVGCSATVVDTVSWDKFSYLLSSIMWPFTLRCIMEGKELIESKTHQV